MNVNCARLTEKVEEGLVQAAAKTRRGNSRLINEAARDYVEHLDTDEKQWRDTLAAFDEIERDKRDE